MRKCAAIAFLSWRNGVEASDNYSELTARLLHSVPTYSNRIKDLLNDANMPRVLFTAETLLAILRVAVVEQSSGNPNVSDKQFSDNFLRATLAANELNLEELVPFNMERSAIDLTASELRSMLGHVAHPHIAYGRTEAFFTWSNGDRARGHCDYLDLDADLTKITSIDHKEFAASAYAVCSRTANASTFADILKIGVEFDVDQWLADMADSRAIRAWLEVASIKEATIREEWRDEPSLSFAGAGSLYRHPIITVDRDLCIAPSPALLTNAMGDGIYFSLLDGYNEVNKNKLFRFYGAFFEDYVTGIFERGYALRDAFVSPEIEYKHAVKSSDTFISANGDVFFVETVAKRMNLVKSILRLDPTQIQNDLEQGVLKKIRQLDRNVEDFRSGVLFPEVERIDGQRIFPVLVSPKSFPRILVISKILEDASKENLLRHTEPIEFLDIEEVEMLESNLIAGLNFGELLQRKNRSTQQRRFMTLNNYLIDEEPQTAKQGNLALERGNTEVQSLIDGMITQWFGRPAAT